MLGMTAILPSQVQFNGQRLISSTPVKRQDLGERAFGARAECTDQVQKWHLVLALPVSQRFNLLVPTLELSRKLVTRRTGVWTGGV